MTYLLLLVTKSLAHYNHQTNRYRLLETLRAFALERLADADETQTISEQHGLWYLHSLH